MIEQLVTVLEQRFADLTAEEIADILWLTLQQWQVSAAHLPAVHSGLSSVEPLLKDEIVPTDKPLVQPPLGKPLTSSPPQMAGLTTTRSQRQAQSQTTSSPEVPLAIPDAPALRQSLELLKALRPLIRRVPSAEAKALDVPATVRAIAETDLWLLKLQPVLEPWLELAIVVDATASMVIWQHTILSLRRVLAQSGVFRDVRMWSLEAQDLTDRTTDQTAPEPKLCLRAGFGPAAASQTPCRPQELLDPNGRRLILVISDCIAPRWETQQIREILRVWAAHGPMALIQVLPEWLWARTALREVVKGQVYSLTAGQANQSLTFLRRERWRRKNPPGVKVPVITLEPAVAKRWSQMVAGKTTISAPALFFSSASPERLALEQEAKAQAQSSVPTGLTPQQRLEQFRNFSSPMARRLAGLLAACPEVNLPIMRMVQAAMLPESQQVHVAEVLLGGLFKPPAEITAHTPANQVQYVFYDGVQPLVQDTVPPERAFAALSTWLNHRFGYSLEDFRAYVTPERIEQVKPFAGILLDVLKRRGSKYAAIVNSIERVYQPQYSTFTELTEHKTATQDYEIRSRIGSSGIAIIAIHGGNLQPGTTQIADAIAGSAHSFYSFVSLKPEIDQTLYIPNTQFDEPIAQEMVCNARTVLTIHGCQGDAEFIRVSGADRDRIEAIIPILTREAFTVNDDRSAGTHPNNICNQGLTRRGVQIEISRGLRDRLISAEGEILERNRFHQMVSALQQGLETAQLVDNIPSSQVSASHTKPQDVSLPNLDMPTFYRACSPNKTLNVGQQEDRQYYVDFSAVRGGDVVRDLRQTITNQQHESTCQLFTGGIGCGKSTELLRLTAELQNYGFQVVYFVSSDDLEIEDVDISDVLLAIARRISESLEDFQLSPQATGFRGLLDATKKVLLTEVDVKAVASLLGGKVGVDTTKREVSLSAGIAELTVTAKNDQGLREKLNQFLGPQKNKLLETINQELIEPAIAQLQRIGKNGLVVIIDNLDRIDNRQKSASRSQQEYLFVDQNECLLGLHCHVVYTMPLALRFSPDYGILQQWFGEAPKILPMVPVQYRDGSDCEAGMNLLRQMVLARAFPELSPEERFSQLTEVFDSIESLDRLCRICGGHVRNLLRLLSEWIAEGKQLPLAGDVLEKLIRASRNDTTMTIAKEEWDLLRQVHQTRRVGPDLGYQTLIRQRLVFEYYDSDGSWFTVNPILLGASELRI